MATNFDYKVRNPEMKELLVEMGGVINALEGGSVAASGSCGSYRYFVDCPSPLLPTPPLFPKV